ncbi:HlyD family secretion protein [Alteromonas antoniana]|uniref:HlyD family secretion protein n=1 Tax=Alteromonas antoniana TaxID=2803813 RepID=UPI001C45A2D2|nr:HlyD family efflux transporter periplasmic adaptor subunit [Alteromonas antoniana]
MRTSLFRKQAVEHQRKRLEGSVLVTPSLSSQLVTLLIIAWLVAVTVYLFTQEFSRRETVTGWIAPSEGLIRLHSQSHGGKVIRVLVAQGENVPKGTPLLSVDNARSLLSGGSMEDTLLAELQAQLGRLGEKLTRAQTNHDDEVRQQQSVVQALKDDLARIDELKALTASRLALTSRQRQQLDALASLGHTARYEVEELEARKLQITQEMKQLTRDWHRAAQSLNEQEFTLHQLPQQYQDTVSTLEDEQSQIKQQIARLQSSQIEVIKAPRDGIVTAITVGIGQFVDSGVPVISMIPANTDIEATLLVPVSAAGFVTEGQPLSVRYDAFPYQKFGMHQGQIKRISASVILPGELTGAPVNVNEPAYLVKASLQSDRLEAYGQAVRLKPGMTLTADVTLSHRTLVEWLFEPLYTLAGRI